MPNVINVSVPPDVGNPQSAPIRDNFVTIDQYLQMLEPLYSNLGSSASKIVRANSAGSALEFATSPSVTIAKPVILITGDSTLLRTDTVPAAGTDEIRAPLIVVRHGTDPSLPITLTIPQNAGSGSTADIWNILVHPDQTGTVTLAVAGTGTVNGASSVTIDPPGSVGTMVAVAAYENSSGTAPKCWASGVSTGETLSGPLTVTGLITAQAGLDLQSQILDRPLRRVVEVTASRQIGASGFETDIGAILRCTSAVTLTLATSTFPDGAGVLVLNDSSGTVTLQGPSSNRTLAAPSGSTFEVAVVVRAGSRFLTDVASTTNVG